jgi:SAM-dependent methyltransferase
VLAPAYDLLTAGYAYDAWLDAIEALAGEHGLRGRRVLDVACGTGRSFAPLLRRGYAVTACDGSAEMASAAARRADGRAAIHVADMRELPRYGGFDLVLCLDDVINHLTEPGDVVAALAGMRANLAPDGLLVFDVNTALAYASGHDVIREEGDTLVAARGSKVSIDEPGGAVRLVVDVFRAEADGRWRRSTATWIHRHYPVGQVRELAARAGLHALTVRGQRRGGVIDHNLDEQVHRKAVVVARG